MALARQLTIAPNTVVHLATALAEASDDYVGGEYLLSNEGTVTVEIGGADIATAGNGSRVLKAGVIVGVDVDPADDVCLYVRGGSTSGLVDAFGSR